MSASSSGPSPAPSAPSISSPTAATAPDVAAAAADPAGLWQIPAFRAYTGMRLSWILAQEILTVALGWLIYERTRSTLALGFVGLSSFLPSIVLSLFTGAAADRLDRGRIMAACSITMVICAALLCVLSFGSIGWTIYAVVVVQGVARAFAQPASKAMVPRLGPPAMLSRLIAGTNLIQRAATILGPALGGLLIAGGAWVPFAVACACAALALASTFGLGPQRVQGVARQRPDLAMLLGGYKFVFSRPTILGAMSMDLIAVLFGGATALLPFYVAEVFHAGPWALGALRTSIAAGALAMALVLARQPIERMVGRKLLIAVAAFGISTMAFGLSTHIYIGMLCLFAVGASDTISVVLRNALIQVNTPDAMQGRVAAVHSVTAGASNDLNEFQSGFMAHSIGGVHAVVLGGAIATLTALAWAWLFPAVRNADRLDDVLPSK